MFRAAYERLVDYYYRLNLAAFEEAGRRADAEIARRLEDSTAAALQAHSPPAGELPPAALPSDPSTTPPVCLPPLPPLHPAVAPKAAGDQPRRPPGRPKGSKNKQEPPQC